MSRKIIITVLSTMRAKTKDERTKNQMTYTCDKGGSIVTDWTNEAGLIYLLRNDTGFTDIICLCSEATFDSYYFEAVRDIVIRETDIKDVHSPLPDKSDENCKKIVLDIVNKETQEKISIHFIKYSTDDEAAYINDALTGNFSFTNSDTVCIDTSGGYRSAVYSLVYLFRYFEYIGVKAEHIIYSSKSGDKCSVKEIENTFSMFTLINGAHEFTSTGNPRTLRKYFSSSKNKNISVLLDNMQEFYDNISLCRIGDELDRSLAAMEELLVKSAPSECKANDTDENRFFELLPVIREKFFAERKSRYLSLVEWCLNNDLLQQAITIYVEKLPKAYFTELGFLTADLEKSEKKSANPGTEIYQDYFITAAQDSTREELCNMIQTREKFIRDPKRRRGTPLITLDKKYEDIYKFILDIRDTFYDDYGNRMTVRNNKRSAKLLDQMYDSPEGLPKTLDKFIFNDSFAGMIMNKSGFKTDSNINKLNGVIEGLNDADVSVNIGKDEIKKLRLDYLYMKYIRNQINHASESSTYSDEYKNAFSSLAPELYKFPKDDNFSADSIRSFLSSSVKEIERIIND